VEMLFDLPSFQIGIGTVENWGVPSNSIDELSCIGVVIRAFASDPSNWNIIARGGRGKESMTPDFVLIRRLVCFVLVNLHFVMGWLPGQIVLRETERGLSCGRLDFGRWVALDLIN
jgi:hypothetical protein